MDAGGALAERSPLPHVVILSSPGAGHFIPLAELARRLAVHHGFSITFIATAADTAAPFYGPLLASLPPGVTALTLPPVDLPAAGGPVTAISLTLLESLPALRRVLASIRPVAFIADFFGTDAFDVASELGVPPFVFFPSNLFLLYFSFHAALFESQEELPNPVELPGCLPVYEKDLPILPTDSSHEEFTRVVHHVKRYTKAQGILVNTFREMEPEAAQVLEEKKPAGWPPVHSVGPLVQTWTPSSVESPCMEWLDKQGDETVLYICLGSIGVLSCDQLREMALGLEMSGHRFLWAMRPPLDKVGGGGGDDDPLGYLPEGFMERTAELGLVVSSWVPQERILSHRAVGGFITHCGWNSVLESVIHGVPMIAWPLYAEQRMNALLLAKRLKVALVAKAAKEDGFVMNEAISAVVVELMAGPEGRAARERLRLLRDAGANAMVEGGASALALDDVVSKWNK